MKRVLLIVLVFGIQMCYGQTVSGTITDSIGGTCVGLEIIAFGKGGEYVADAMTDDSGKYSLVLSENGEYIIEVFDIGRSLVKEKLNVNGDQAHDIHLNEMLDTQVDGVTVVGKVPVIVRKIDRLVYDVEHSVASSGLDLLAAILSTLVV